MNNELKKLKNYSSKNLTNLINKDMKFTITETIQLDEIKRRIKEFKQGNKNAPMIFLGFPSEVKTLVQKGVLTPYSKETKRALNWYNLTEKGKQFV